MAVMSNKAVAKRVVVFFIAPDLQLLGWTYAECGGRIISIRERYGIIIRVITCRKMHAADVRDAFHMLSDFLTEDEHYLASSQAYGDLGVQGLNNALDLFLEHPELG